MTSTARATRLERPLSSLGPTSKISAWHQERLAVVYVRQSTAQQVLVHAESTRLQYGLVSRAEAYGWASDRIVVIDDDLGKSGTTTVGRVGFERLVTEVSLGHVGLIWAWRCRVWRAPMSTGTACSKCVPSLGRSSPTWTGSMIRRCIMTAYYWDSRAP